MKIKFLTGTLILFIWSFFASAQDKPNVLFIMTDQQSYNMMSCMGNKWLHTPNMDKIAEMGYRFDKTYCANPVCMPSRFSLLTGHFASEVGVKENTTAYDSRKVKEIIETDALGVLFRKGGYETLYSGKTHLYGTNDVSEYGFSIFGTDPYEGPALYAEKTFAEMGRTKRKKPFFMFLSFMNPHDICYKAGMDPRFPDGLSEAKAQETTRILAMKETLSEEIYRQQIPPRVKNLTPINDEEPEMVKMASLSRDWSDEEWDLYNWMYHRLTESVDELIGRVLFALEEAQLKENTIIVFTSDHGDMHGAHQLILKNVMFEEAQRVPFIIAGKGIKPNVADTSTLVCNGLDFIPTICDLVGIEYPAELTGISLKPLLTGIGEIPDRKRIVTESFNSYQITDGRYKYTIYELPGHPETLTDVLVNPGESINYKNNPDYMAIKSSLKRELLADLSKRGLTPLPEDRTYKNIRAAEKALNLKKGIKIKDDE